MKKNILLSSIIALSIISSLALAASPATATVTATPITKPAMPLKAAPAVAAINNQPVVSINSIVAVVNNNVITQDQLKQQISIIKMQLEEQHTPLPSEQELSQQVLNQLIDQQLQLELAKRNHIQVSSQQVTQTINDIAVRENTSASNLYQKLQKYDVSRQDFRAQIKNDLIVQKLQQDAMASQIKITPQEVDAYIAKLSNNPQANSQYQVEDILIALPTAPSPRQVQAAQDRADVLVKQLNNGANFQQLAVAQSGGQEALQGGDLGWRSYAELPDAFSNVVTNLKPGQIAGPIRTPNGFHIVKLVGVRQTTLKISDDQRAQVEQLIFQQKMLEALQSWVSQLRAQAYIKIIPTPLVPLQNKS